LNDIDKTIIEGIERAGLPGAVALIGERDGVTYAKAFGSRGVDDSAPMTLDTPFWFASMTKAVTSVAAMQLVEQGRLALDEPIGAVLPKLANPRVLTDFDDAGAPITRPAKRAISLRHLLTHTAGFGYDFMNPAVQKSRGPGPAPAGTSLAALETPLLFDPGEQWEYGTSTDWVGLVVETVAGKSLGAYFADHIFAPLGMTRTTFKPDPAELAILHARTPDGRLVSLPPIVMALAHGEYDSGGGGLSGSGGDYMRFLRMILNGGVLDGARVLASDTVEMMSRNQIGALRAGRLTSADASLTTAFDLFPDMHTGWGLGFLINPEPAPGARATGSLAWAGLANTHYWIDPASNRAGLLLTQAFPFGDAAIMRLLRDFETAAYAARPAA